MNRLIDGNALVTKLINHGQANFANFATTTTSSNYVISSEPYWPGNGAITVSGYYGASDTKVRKKCAYCDCLNDTEYGTCKYCGAPLGVVEE